jgi:hypothetical protein
MIKNCLEILLSDIRYFLNFGLNCFDFIEEMDDCC